MVVQPLLAQKKDHICEYYGILATITMEIRIFLFKPKIQPGKPDHVGLTDLTIPSGKPQVSYDHGPREEGDVGITNSCINSTGVCDGDAFGRDSCPNGADETDCIAIWPREVRDHPFIMLAIFEHFLPPTPPVPNMT